MIGHKKQQTFFMQALNSGRLSHAYLLTGPEGVGKRTFAESFSKGLLCPHKSFFERCGCNSCIQIENGSHPDFHIYKDDDINIDNVRQISDIASMSAFFGGWRTVIIDNAHTLSDRRAESANALLKTLEEPGIDTVFFLISHHPERILPTIHSRCVNVRFEPLSDGELADILKKTGVDPAPVIPYAAGSVSAALALAEIDVNKLLSFIKEKRVDDLGMQIFAMNDINKFSSGVHVIRSYFNSIYKRTLDPDTAVFLQYIDDMLRSLNNTLNLNVLLITLDFYIKLTEFITSAGGKV